MCYSTEPILFSVEQQVEANSAYAERAVLCCHRYKIIAITIHHLCSYQCKLHFTAGSSEVKKGGAIY